MMNSPMDKERFEQTQVVYQRIGRTLLSGNGKYDLGYRDALQSTVLALAQNGAPVDQIKGAVDTALDAFDNNHEKVVAATREAEPLTIAYVAMGAHAAIRALEGLPTRVV